MKKLLCLCLVLILVMSFMAGCGKNEEEKTDNPPSVATEDKTPEITPGTKKEAEVKDVSPKTPPKQTSPANDPVPSDKNTTDNSDKPKVKIILSGGTDETSICYHLENCKELDDTESQVMAWEMVQALAFRQCPTCKPPKYDGYID